ncbi:putative membrane protein [Granulicella pectinivorans]|jgi:putative membrane protein|uniref:Putative membrane protein n=1 Tax=Granulicella pectinivorans TaxID=474950 RepID=A0A1I6MC96_9BACT|nr:bestrophin family ion channel [Granulicella pectinivorans]SFS13314.1 putative membrane protein [Granulicella pectinivorans]
MIVSNDLSFRRIWPQASRRLLVLLIFDCAVAGLYSVTHSKLLTLDGLPIAPLGSALTIFLAFRTNAAYGRWWEARQLWGALVNTSRSLARQFLTLIDNDGGQDGLELKQQLVRYQISFAHALRCHLRKQNPFPELSSSLSPEQIEELRTSSNIPAAINLKMGELLQLTRERGLIDSIRSVAIDENLTQLSNIQGACERIKNTPLPRQFAYLPRILVNVFCYLVPLGLVANLGLMTPIVSVLISFSFIAADLVGSDIENPFENTIHDTPMTALTRTIEINLREHMKDPKPLRGILSADGFVY